MLLKLNRHYGQKIILQDIGHSGDVFSVQVVPSEHGGVGLKFDAPESIVIHREEIWLREQLRQASCHNDSTTNKEEIV